ncbi:MAG: hypothetical protein AAGF84_04310 [Planctomycetota bacterium]
MPTALFRAASVLSIAMFALLAYAGPAFADAAADLDKANGLLRRAESNLQSVQQSVTGRDAPPKGSAGKLLNQRLAQAKGDLEPAGQLLANVSDAAEGAAAAKQRLAGAVALYNELNTFMSGGNAPAADAEADAGGVKLNYQQEETLKNARFHLREVQGNVAALMPLLEQFRVVEDQLTVPHAQVSNAIATIENANRKAGFVADNLKQLPADGAGVATVANDLNTANAQVAVAAEYFKPLHAKLQQLINPASYPQLESDIKRLRELSAMYARPEILQSDIPQAIAVLKQASAAQQEVVRIAQKYGDLLKQTTPDTERLEGVGNGFFSTAQRFTTAAQTRAAELPAQIQAKLAEVRGLADQAVQEQKPLFFTGGIPQQMGFAREWTDLLETLQPEAAAPLRTELSQLETDLAAKAKSLEALIIQQNPLPSDNYAGPDRDAVIERAVDAWKHQQSNFEVLTVRIPRENWKRQTVWEWFNGAFHYVDKSRLQVQLILADPDNPDQAIIQPINMIRDHQDGDTVIGTPMRSGDEEVQPHGRLLRSKI